MSTHARTLRAKLSEDITHALKAGEKTRLGALRLLLASIQNREKDVLHELSDDEVREVAGKEVKRRNEAIEAYQSAGREELAAKEREEREVLAAYAPEQLSDSEVDALVEEALIATGATSPQELGKVMGAVMEKAKGRADGAVVKQKVLGRLGLA